MAKKPQHKVLEDAFNAREEDLKDGHEDQLRVLQDNFDELENEVIERDDMIQGLAEKDKEINRLAKQFGLILSGGKIVPILNLHADQPPVKKGARKAAGRLAPKLDMSQYHLADFILLAMSQDIKHPATFADFALDYGYKTASKSFQDVVHQCLSQSKFFRRHGRANWGRTRHGMARWLQVQKPMGQYFESIRRELP